MTITPSLSSAGDHSRPSNKSRFSIPSSLQDLERDPYNLLPYPVDFDDNEDDEDGNEEVYRAAAFNRLLDLLREGNEILSTAEDPMTLFLIQQALPHSSASDLQLDNDDYHIESAPMPWMDHVRMQAMYTLVRKSASLSSTTRQALSDVLADAVHQLIEIIKTIPVGETVPQNFRDAWACHVYMICTTSFLLESDAKGSSKPIDRSSSNNISRRRPAGDDSNNILVQFRQTNAQVMLEAAHAMAMYRQTLWQRGVADENVVILPARVAFSLLELATGVMARKAVSADIALQILAETLDGASKQQQQPELGSSFVLTTVTAALVDLMHTYEHMSAVVAELCTLVSEQPTNLLAVELLREMGRLPLSTGLDSGRYATGVKNLAPFVSELAAVRPKIVLSQIAHFVPQLNSESYNFRSAIVTAFGHLLEYLLVDRNMERAEMASSSSQETLLDLLTERVHDVSSYTRSTVLKAWISLAVAKVLPKDRVLPVTRIARDRLQDKTVIVRKQAMQLLTTLLENNPFMGSLDPAPYRHKLNELYDYVQANMPPSIRDAHWADLKQAKETGDSHTVKEIEQAALAAALAEAETFILDSTDSSQEEFYRKVQALKFTQSALDFIDVFDEATKNIEGMLLSASASDVTEALHFFVQARHFQLPCAVDGIKRSLALMWSSEPGIRDEVLQAFVAVFLAVPGSDTLELLPDNQIAKNLLVLVGQASASELASIEEAVQLLVKEERIPADVFLILWSIVSSGSGDARAAALHVLSMGASADPSLIDSKSRLKVLLEAGLGEYTQNHKDWKLARATAIALQRVARAVVDPNDAKYLVLERIIGELYALVRGDWCRNPISEKETLQWFPAAEQAIKALFVISHEPENACRDIVLGMYNAILERNSHECDSLRLAMLFHVLGQVALNLLVYTEALSTSVRRANAKRTLKKQEEVGKTRARNQSHIEYKDGCDEEDAIEAELGMAAEAEAENERKMADISEKEILGRGLISMFGPVLVRVVANEGGSFKSAILVQSAVLALCKFMCVSGSFCEKHLPLLFTALMNSPPEDTTMRANTVVALGDLAFRFPNEVEPYTPRLYACLRDASTRVRRHALMVLTHLILNDMVKVKGQVCEIVLCLRDQDPRIRDMSRLLFRELSKRSNSPVYNLLPDIISQLSQSQIRKEDFRNIVSFLLAFIQKERQSEMLTEKLCQRFLKCSSPSQNADIAFCLSLLKMNERSIKYLSDNFKVYKDALSDEEVMKLFLSIVTKTKKFMKPEMRQFIEEWEAKLNQLASVGTENELARENASHALARASRKAARRNTHQAKPLNKNLTTIEDQDDEGNEEMAIDEDSRYESDSVNDHKENRRSSLSISKTMKTPRRFRRGAVK